MNDSYTFFALLASWPKSIAFHVVVVWLHRPRRMCREADQDGEHEVYMFGEIEAGWHRAGLSTRAMHQRKPLGVLL